MDTLHFCIAVVPLSAYLLLIGLINLRTRPLITSGVRDLAALAMAVTGFVIVGPMELFLPEVVAELIGGWVWLPMLSVYLVFVGVTLLMLRPQLLVYNIQAEPLREMLRECGSGLDQSMQWMGDSMSLPALGVQLSIEDSPGTRHVILRAVGHDQSPTGWMRLHAALRDRLAQHQSPLNSHGLSLILLSMLLVSAVLYTLLTHSQDVAQAMQQMLRM